MQGFIRSELFFEVQTLMVGRHIALFLLLQFVFHFKICSVCHHGHEVMGEFSEHSLILFCRIFYRVLYPFCTLFDL